MGVAIYSLRFLCIFLLKFLPYLVSSDFNYIDIQYSDLVCSKVLVFCFVSDPRWKVLITPRLPVQHHVALKTSDNITLRCDTDHKCSTAKVLQVFHRFQLIFSIPRCAVVCLTSPLLSVRVWTLLLLPFFKYNH